MYATASFPLGSEGGALRVGQPLLSPIPNLARDVPFLTTFLLSLGARDLWSRCLNSALAGVIAHRDSRAWLEFLILPSLVLPSPSRGGTSRTRRSINETRRRCQDWLNGVRLELWDPLKRALARDTTNGKSSSPEQSFELDDRLASWVQSLISEGSLRRVCTALTCEPPVVPSLEVVDELSGLHPGPTKAHQEAIDQLRDVGPGAVPVTDPDLIRKALSSFSPTSGAGPSRLRPSHLQEALRHSSGDQTLRLISEVIQLMLHGEVPEDIRQWICGASLMALRKLNGSLRPVAVGESLRRLCSKVAVELMDSSVKSILEPVQVGVQTKAGCEAIIHNTRQWTKSFCNNPDRVLVLLDLSNAFNCVSRGAVLSAVRRHFP